MEKVGIIGYGVVGKAIDLTMSSKFKVIKFDKFRKYDSFEKLLESNFIFISVPTPFNNSSQKTDDSAVTESLERLNTSGFSGIVIIKSTLALGSLDSYSSRYDLNLVFNPEFLRESTSPDEDFKEQTTVVLGTESVIHFNSVKKNV